MLINNNNNKKENHETTNQDFVILTTNTLPQTVDEEAEVLLSDTNDWLFKADLGNNYHEDDNDTIDPDDYVCCLKFNPLQYVIAITFLGIYNGSAIAQSLTEKHIHTGEDIDISTIVICSLAAFLASFEVSGQSMVHKMDDAWVMMASRKNPRRWRTNEPIDPKDWPALSNRRERFAVFSALTGTLWLSSTTALAANVFLANLAADYESFPIDPKNPIWKWTLIIIPTGIALTNVFARFAPLYGGIRRMLSDQFADDSWRNLTRKIFGAGIGAVNASKMGIQVYDIVRTKFPFENDSYENYFLIGSILLMAPILGANGYINGSEGVHRVLHTRKEDLNFKRVSCFLIAVSAGGFLGVQLYYLYQSFLLAISNNYDENGSEDNANGWASTITASIFAINQAIEMATALHIGGYNLASTIEKKGESLLSKLSWFNRDREQDINEQTSLINQDPIEIEVHDRAIGEEPEDKPNLCGVM